MVEVEIVDGGLPLDPDPAWARAINTILIKEGIRVNALRPVSDVSLPKENAPRRLSRSLSQRLV
jgi:hypothetical protein